MKKYDLENGITLIALTITIIIILILAGVGIIVLNGENSILNKATESVVANNEEVAREIVLMAANAVKIKKATYQMNKDEIKDELEYEIENSSGDDATVEIGRNTYLVDFRGYKFEISDDLANVSYNEQIIIEKTFKNERILGDCEGKFEENTAIKIEFDPDSVNQDNWLNVYMFDSNNNFIKCYSSTELIGKAIYLNDKGVKFKLQNFNKVLNYTFKCIITPTDELEYGGTETLYPYKSNSEYAFTTKLDDAEQVLVKFSNDSLIKNNDCIELYSFIQNSEQDFSANRINRIIGNEITSKEFAVSRNTVGMVLSSKEGQPEEIYGIKYTVEKYETPNNILESSHDYEDNLFGKTYEKTIPGAKKIKLTFNEETYFEDGCDSLKILYVVNDEEILLGEYTGDELAGVELLIPADNVKMMLYSDFAFSYYGFRCEIEKVELEKIYE